jgi:predicted PurR-regulated permease PerM
MRSASRPGRTIRSCASSVLAPLVRFFARHRIPRGAGAGLVLVLIVLAGAAIAMLVLSRISALSSDINAELQSAVTKIEGCLKDLGVSSDTASQAKFNGIVIGLGALVLGVPFAGSIAIVNFVAAYIPYLGAWTAGAFTVLIALGDSGASTAIAMAVIILLANGALQQLIQPIAYGAALGIHPLAVLIVTIAGGALFGTIGLIIAAPLTSAAVKISADLGRARADTADEAAPATEPASSPAPG